MFLGVGFTKGVCQNVTEMTNDAYEEIRTEVYRGSAIVSDNGAYGGIIVAAHELGHVLVIS